MTIIKSSLIKAMNNGVKKRRQKFAAIVIDEQGGKPKNFDALKTTLDEAARLRMPIYLIEIDGKVNKQNVGPIQIGSKPNALVKTCKELQYEGAIVVKKPHISMFNPKASLDMKAEILKKQIDAVVIMGTKTNQCVKTNAVGGFVDRKCETHFDGLNKLCAVYTCPDILRDVSEATWKNERRVFFHTQLND